MQHIKVLPYLYTVIPGYYNPFLGSRVKPRDLVRRSIDNVINTPNTLVNKVNTTRFCSSAVAAYQLTVGIKYYTGRGPEKFDNLPTLKSYRWIDMSRRKDFSPGVVSIAI